MDEEFDLTEIIDTNLGTSEEANGAALSLLPAKSKTKYEFAYQRFMDYRKNHDITSFSEQVLLGYFTFLSKTLKASTLWATYSMLRITLTMKHDVDISKFLKLKMFLKQQGDGYVPKKASIFNQEQIEKFVFEAPDEYFLLIKVAAIFGMSGACRREDLCKMTIGDIDHMGTKLLVNIPATDTSKARAFIVNETYIPTYEKYVALRPAGFENKKFFFNIRNGKPIKQVVGIHTFGRMPQLIAQYLDLPNPDTYNGHSFRRSSANVVVNVNDRPLGSLPSTVTSEDCNDSQPIASSINNKQISIEVDASKMIMAPLISNCHNCTINITMNNPKGN